MRTPGREVREPAGRQLSERLRPARVQIGVTFCIFLGINLLLLAAYLWSRGGQTTHVRVEARGSNFVAYVDGRLHARGQFAAPAQGGITLTLADTKDVPSLPAPRGIDRVLVTDLSTGAVLFEDNFSSGPAADWKVLGTFSSGDGVLDSRGEGNLLLTDRPWRDYAVDLDLKNSTASAITVRAREDGTGVSYGLRPFLHYDNGFSFTAQDGTQSFAAGPLIELSRSETLKALVAMTLRPYPLVFLLLALGFIAVAGLQFAGALRVPLRLPAISTDVPWFAAAAVAAFGFVVTLFLNYSYNSHMPHVPDEVAYLFQAKLFASGRFAAPPPPVPEVFDFFYPPFILLFDGKWASVYPFGHPLVLAIGVRAGAVWLIPSALGAASVLLVFAIGRQVYNARVGLLAALLFATSPFFLMTASNFMSHNTAAFYLLASLLFLTIAERRPLLYGALAGLFFGLLFNTQPLTAAGIIPPFALLLLSLGLPPDRRLVGAKQIAGFAAGALLMLGAYFLYNLATTGDAFTSALQKGANPGQTVGFGGAHSPSIGIQNEHIQMAFLLLVLNGWPVYVGLMFVLLPFVLGTRHRWDWFLLGLAIFALGIYVLFIGHGIMHGPRYWYVASPLLMLLTARGAERAAEVLATGAGAVRRALSGVDRQPRWAGVLVVYGLVAALVGSSLYGWLLGQHPTWSNEFVPARATELRGFNGADDRLVKLIEEADLHNALVLVQGDCPGWQCYGTVFWLNSPTLDGDVVLARDLPQRRAELLAAYPDRFVYTATYSQASLTPYGKTAPVVGRPSDNGQPAAPRARDIPVTPVLPPPTATPEPGGAAQRDEQRRRDLAAIARALQEYYQLHGSYPLAEGLQSFCRFRELDAGCKLAEVLDPLPRDPLPDETYWYLSNGQTFTVFAVMEETVSPSQCPEDPALRPGASLDHLYCVQGSPQETG